MKITLVQTDIAWGDPQANFKHLDALLSGAPHSDLYVLPEMFSTGFATPPDATVEQEPSAGLAWMQRKAAELGAAFAGSIALQPRGETKRVNRFFFVRPDGSYVRYDKRHLFGYGGEGERFQGGTERVIVEYGGVRFLLAVCYDLRFPVWLRNRDDYDAILLVASWPDVRRFAWDTLSRARAIENACYVAAVNRVGEDPACKYDGGTAFIGPYGETLAAAPDAREGLVCGEIDLDRLAEYHAKFPVLEDADAFDIR
ncbi:MAG: amidohydrolase [Bacteroidales bacterium]|nr:amidohydrolase [Bacteroidales bacterium]